MTAMALVARLRSRGIAIEPDGPFLVVRPANAVSADEVEALRRLKPEVLRDLAYRKALRQVWALAAEGGRADPAACLAAFDELVRRLDDVGEPAATEHRRRWENEWHRETGRCPRCGETGPRHDP